MHDLKLRPPAECLNHSGSVVAQFALLMAGLSGKRKVTRSSPTSFIGPMASRYSWQRSAERGDEAEGFLIVTAAAGKGLVDIHNRRPLVLSPEAAREWLRQDVGGKEAEDIVADGSVPADKFLWHAVTRAVGNVKNQGPELIQTIR